MTSNTKLKPAKTGTDRYIQELVLLNVRSQGKAGEIPDTQLGKRAVLRSHTVIYAGNVIGADFQTGHGVLIRESNQIGNHVSVGSHTMIEHHVRIADGVRIHSNAFIPEYTVIDQKAWIGPGVVITNAKYPGAKRTKEFLSGVVIGEGAKIGAGSVILPGVNIGKHSIVGAGSVVTKDVPPNIVVAGNPAHKLRHVKNLIFPDGSQVYDE